MRIANSYFRSRVLYFFILLVSFIIIWGSCKKKDDTTTTTTTSNTPTLTNHPTASAANDHNAGGIYKGIVTGSSGYVYIYFKNSTNDVYAILDFDGTRDSLICPALNGYTLPGADINNAMFLSAMGKQDTILFSVKADGSNPSMVVKIPGHSTSTSIRKETSDQELRVYQGSVYDTLVAGFYWCGSSKVLTLGSVRQSHITAMVQGNTAVLLMSNYLPPCTSSKPMESFVLQVNNGIIEFDENGPPKKKNKITVTDAGLTGTSICTIPIDLGGEIDAYNSSISTVRVK